MTKKGTLLTCKAWLSAAFVDGGCGFFTSFTESDSLEGLLVCESGLAVVWFTGCGFFCWAL